MYKARQTQFAELCWPASYRSVAVSFVECSRVLWLEISSNFWNFRTFNEISNFSLADGLVLGKDEGVMGRSTPINFVDQDPNDIRWAFWEFGAVAELIRLEN